MLTQLILKCVLESLLEVLSKRKALSWSVLIQGELLLAKPQAASSLPGPPQTPGSIRPINHRDTSDTNRLWHQCPCDSVLCAASTATACPSQQLQGKNPRKPELSVHLRQQVPPVPLGSEASHGAAAG